jgi:hypothetical protein
MRQAIAMRVDPRALTKDAQFPAMQARLHSFRSSFDYWPLPPAVVAPGDVLLASGNNQHKGELVYRLAGISSASRLMTARRALYSTALVLAMAYP